VAVGPRPAPRRRLVFLLSGAAGYLDAVGYLTLGLFTANMTGNTVLLGIALGRGRIPAVTHALLALVAFLAGGVCATAILLKGRRLGYAFALEAVLLLAALAAWSRLGAGPPAAGIPGRLAPLLIVLLASAMGAQSAAVRRVGEQRISTPYVTGLLTSVAVDAVEEYLRARWDKPGASLPPAATPSSRPVLLGIWGSYLLGGAAGGFAEVRYGFAAVVLPWLVLTLAAAWERVWTSKPLGLKRERTG
jgi:uncharacterized membrane protein YoaK (UPF0700 family)